MLTLRFRLITTKFGIGKPTPYDHHLIWIHEVRAAAAMCIRFAITSSKRESLDPLIRRQGEYVNVVKRSRSAEAVANRRDIYSRFVSDI
jgi:hypothetical protein